MSAVTVSVGGRTRSLSSGPAVAALAAALLALTLLAGLFGRWTAPAAAAPSHGPVSARPAPTAALVPGGAPAVVGPQRRMIEGQPCVVGRPC